MFCFALTYACYKATESFISINQVLCFANFFSWIIILPFVLKNGVKFLVAERFFMIVLRTLLGMAVVYCISLALKNISLSEVVLLNNTAPLFVPFIVWICHGTKISHSLWIGLIIGFIGVFIILRPGFEEINSGLLIALLSGLASAGMLVTLRQIAHQPLLRILFYYFLIFWVLFAPSLIGDWPSVLLQIWFLLFLSGASMVAAQVTLTAAMRYATSHEIAPTLYTSVIFAGLIDWIFWKNKPTLLSVLGMVVVCIGGMITMLVKKEKS
jgi:drug/metabolite transporter (DMT)-like permease